MTARKDVVREAVIEGGTVALESFRESLTVDTKSSKMDYVTDADRRAQERVIEVIERNAWDGEDATIVAEEGSAPKEVPPDDDAWVIDPIDGTTNFVHDTPLWTTTVASLESGRPVAAATNVPGLDDLYWSNARSTYRNEERVSVSSVSDPAEFTAAPMLRYGSDRDEEFGGLMRDLIVRFGDLRRLGCAQLTLAMVASGSLDAAVSTQPEPNPWDTIAGVLLVKAAGGTVTDVEGEPWDPTSSGIVASNGEIHGEVVECVSNAAAAARGGES